MHSTTIPLTLVGLAFAFFSSDSARAAGRVVDRDVCQDGVRLKLEAEGEREREGERSPRRIDLEFELDEARPGDRWRMILRNGKRGISRVTRTVGPSEEISIRRRIRNRPGAERISVAAINLETRQRCQVAVRFRR
jgi:hypothetical protein